MIQSAAELRKLGAAAPQARGPNAKEEGIIFAIDVSKKRPTRLSTTSKDPVHFVRIRIGSIAAQKAELKAGDKVDLKWDKDRRLGFIAPSEDGWTLTGLKREKGEGKKSNGLEALQLRFTWEYGYPSIYEPKLREAVIIEGDLGNNEIQFVFPEGTSFAGLSTRTSEVIQYNRRATDRQAVA
jgi:hypothetical protein